MKRGGFLKRKARLRKTSNSKVPSLKRELWKVFADYVKERDGWKCFTCGRRVKGSSANAGHFIPKAAGGLALYFHEDNVHCQCVYCNLALEGNHYEYGLRLGPEKVAELTKLKNVVVQWSPRNYEEKINLYKQKLEALSQ